MRICKWCDHRNCIYKGSRTLCRFKKGYTFFHNLNSAGMNLVIINYNAGNTKSVQHALHRIGVEAILTDDAEVISSADKIIFPGVGHAAATMNYLREKKLDT